MHKLDKIIYQIDDELEGAEDYADASILYRDIDREISEQYAMMSNAELNHVNTLRLIGNKIVNESETAMKPVWDWNTEKVVQCVSKIKLKLK